MKQIQSARAALAAGVLMVIPALASAQTPAATAATPDQLVAEYIAAQGGIERIRSIQSVYTTGELSIPSQGLSLPLTIIQKRPNKMRVDILIPDMGVEIANGFDGTVAWESNPLQGGTRELTGEPARNVAEQADLDGVLVDYAAKGYRLAYAGAGEVRGKPTQQLRLTRPDSSTIVLHLDAVSHLQIKAEGLGTHPVTGAEVKVETFLSDYRDVGGVKMPFAIEVTLDGQPFQGIKVETVQVNQQVDDGQFSMPKSPSTQ